MDFLDVCRVVFYLTKAIHIASEVIAVITEIKNRLEKGCPDEQHSAN